MNVDEIIFYPITDFPEYCFSLCNKIYSVRKNKILAPRRTRRGYYQAHLYQGGKVTPKYIHRIIAEHFIPNPENKPCVDHKNHIITDNRIENLRWATCKENSSNIYKEATDSYWPGIFYKNKSFIAYWNDENNKNRSKSFSTEQYGIFALLLAIDKRKEMVDKLYNRPEPEIKCF